MDRYLWKLGKVLIGKQATRVALIFHVTNKAFTEIIIRCFANGIEATLNVISMYYFLRLKGSFNMDYVKITTLMSINFMVRNTSAIPWIPLFLIKIIKDSALLPLIISAIFVAVPVVGSCVALDSYFYNFD